MKKAYSITNTIIGVAYLLIFALGGYKAGGISLVIFIVMLGLHLGAGIGKLAKQDWGDLMAKILGWVGTILWGLLFLVILIGAGRLTSMLAANPFLRSFAAGGFIGAFSMFVIVFVPFITYYLMQILISDK